MSSMSTSIYEQVQEMYSMRPEMYLEADLRRAMQGGFVSINFRHFLIVYDLGFGWLVHLAVGHGCLQEFMRIMPYERPVIGWARVLRGRSEVRWHETSKVRRAINIATYERKQNRA
jgi:hypothetical protein